MKKKKQQPRASAPAAFRLRGWHIAAGAMMALLAVLQAYGPALNGPFVFDDFYLPFYSHDFADKPLAEAVRGVRPFLMFTFWLNHSLSELDPYTYHLFNVLFHFLNGVLVFFIVRRILAWAEVEANRRELFSAFAAGLFLLHPVQTESVAYVASRSETLSVLFFHAAFAVFLYRRSEAVSWPASFGVLLLFAAAASTKEHTVALPAALLLTDYFWNRRFSFEGIRRNWRLYVPLAAGAAFGLAFVWRVLSQAETAGFAMKDLPWHHYFYTQCRALWVYFRLFLLPAGQNADYQYPISRSLLDHGAIFGLAGLLVLVGCALYYRRPFPLASYGFLLALLLFAPTSSFVPIQDAVAERRLYLPMIGLLLVPIEFLRRWNAGRSAVAGTLAAVLLVAGALTYQRSKVWSSEVALWEDVVAKSPENSRAHFHLALAYYDQGRCESAAEHYEEVARLGPTGHRLLANWALAEDCRNRPDAALDKLHRASEMRKSAHVYSLIGMVHGKQGRLEQAMAALDTAESIDSRYDMTYVYRGNVYALSGDFSRAASEYRRALALNPNNEMARNGLRTAESRLKTGR